MEGWRRSYVRFRWLTVSNPFYQRSFTIPHHSELIMPEDLAVRMPWDNIRPMNKSRKDKPDVPGFFRVDDGVRLAMQHQMDEVGLDGQRFGYNREEQGACHDLIIFASAYSRLDEAYELIDELGIHIPRFSLRDVVSKLTICHSNKTVVKAKTKGGKDFTRIARYYLCACATDHTSGSKAVKNRQIAWENVGCLAWVKLTTTHAEDGASIKTDHKRVLISHSRDVVGG